MSNLRSGPKVRSSAFIVAFPSRFRARPFFHPPGPLLSLTLPPRLRLTPVVKVRALSGLVVLLRPVGKGVTVVAAPDTAVILLFSQAKVETRPCVSARVRRARAALCPEPPRLGSVPRTHYTPRRARQRQPQLSATGRLTY